MLRALVIVLLLANAGFLAWSHGWLAPAWPAPRSGEREPERLAAQVRPEAVTVLPARAASDAISAAHEAAASCLEAGPLAEADIPAAEASVATAQLPEGAWVRTTVKAAPQWWVYAGRVKDPAGLKQRADELRALGLSFEVVDAPPDLATGLVLSRHATRAAADAALAGLSPAAAKGVRVVALPEQPAQQWLRVAHAEGDQQERLKALAPEALAGGFRPCAPRP